MPCSSTPSSRRPGPTMADAWLGATVLSGGKVGGQVSLDRATLASAGGAALIASGLRASTLTLTPAVPIRGLVDLGA